MSTVPNSTIGHASPREREHEAELEQIRDALRGLRFGSVNVIVQDGVVVQIDRLEKRRLRRPDRSTEASGACTT